MYLYPRSRGRNLSSGPRSLCRRCRGTRGREFRYWLCRAQVIRNEGRAVGCVSVTPLLACGPAASIRARSAGCRRTTARGRENCGATNRVVNRDFIRGIAASRLFCGRFSGVANKNVPSFKT